MLLESGANLIGDDASVVTVGNVKAHLTPVAVALAAIEDEAPIEDAPELPHLLIETNGGQLDISDLSGEDGIICINDDVVLGTPTRDGYKFAGWYTDADLTKQFDFATRITKATKLNAKWKAVEADANDHSIILTLNDKRVTVYGEEQINDIAPLLVNDRVMMPTRFVAKKLFCTVHWNEATGIVTIKGKHFTSGKNMEILLTVNSDKAIVNGQTVTLDSTTFLQNDRIYTPLRFIAETLGATVDWNSNTKNITVILPATTISDECIVTLKLVK